jgi:hypothetical protein
MPGYRGICYQVSPGILCKYLMINNLEARGVEPLFRAWSSKGVHRCPARGDSRAIRKAWITPDGAGCYHFCYHNSRLWPVSGNDQIRNILPRLSGGLSGPGAANATSVRSKQRGKPQSRLGVRKLLGSLRGFNYGRHHG